MAARSVKCILENDSSHVLTLANAELAHGIFAQAPPNTAPAKSSVSWEAESDGFMTGTEGHAAYFVGETGARLVISWNNPFVGASEFSQRFVQPRDGYPGVPDYLPFDPQSPPGSDRRPYDPKRVEPPDPHADNVAVTYRLSVGAEAQGVDGESPDTNARPSNLDPKPVIAGGSLQPTVKDADVRFHKLVYLGLNDPQANGEADGLDGLGVGYRPPKGRTPYLTKLCPSSSQRLVEMSVDDFADTLVSLGRDTKNYSALEEAHDPIVPIARQRGACDRRFAMRSLAQVFDAVERELQGMGNPDIEAKLEREERGAAPLKRLVLSGHHWQGWTNGRPDVIWGSDRSNLGRENFDRALTLFHGLRGLARLFPNASAQVEHLMFSACGTGFWAWGIILDRPEILETFPNLETVWGYASLSPTGKVAERAIHTWAVASEGPDVEHNLVSAAAAQRKLGFAGVPIVWRRAANGLEPVKEPGMIAFYE